MLVKSSSTSYDTAWATPVTSSDLALKANLANPTFTGTVAGITKTMVGLGSVDNTTDASKPISTAQQTALNLKAPLASPALTGTPTSTTAAPGTNNTQIATTAYTDAAVAALVDSAPATLNTLDELALALGDDANFATTTATAIGLKAPLSSPALTGTPTAPTASVGTNTTQIATTEFVQVANPTGAVIAFAGSSAPTNWLLCYGQAVSRTTYAALFAVVSTTYGAGDGTTTFNLPDLRGRTVAGVDNMGGSDAGRIDIANSSGTVVGSQYVTLTSAEMPSHTHIQDSHNHTQNAHGHVVSANSFASDLQIVVGPLGGDGNKYSFSDSGNDASSNTAVLYARDTTATNIATTATNQNTGGGGAHNNMQPTMVLNYIIKA
jgi:microcystin-dependent protein